MDAVRQQELVKHSDKVNGHKNISASADIVGDFKRNPWKTGFKDDYDARY